MYLTNVIALAGFFAGVLSTPLRGPGHFVEGAEKRNQAHHIYACSGANWTGECFLSELYDSQCMPLSPSKSFGPDPILTCVIYETYDCMGPGAKIYYPGNANLAGSFSSYKCCSDGPNCKLAL